MEAENRLADNRLAVQLFFVQNEKASTKTLAGLSISLTSLFVPYLVLSSEMMKFAHKMNK